MRRLTLILLCALLLAVPVSAQVVKINGPYINSAGVARGPVYIGATAPPTDEYNSLYVVTPSMTGNVGRAGNFESHFAGTYGSTAIQAAAYLEGSNTQNHANAVQAYVYGRGASISGWVAGFFAAKDITSGTIPTYYGFYNRVGGTGATNNYAFYSDALDPSLTLGKWALSDVVLTNALMPQPLFVYKPFAVGASGITTAQVGVYANNAAAVGAGGAIAFGGKTGLASDPYPNAYVLGARASLATYEGYFSVYTTSGGGRGEINSGNYERLRVTAAGVSFGPPTGNTLRGSSMVSNELVTIDMATATGTGTGTVTSTAAFPANSLGWGMTCKVTTILAGAGLTTISIGDGTDADRWGAGIAITAGTTINLANWTAAPPWSYAAATSIVVTADAGVLSTGVLSCTPTYWTFSPIGS